MRRKAASRPDQALAPLRTMALALFLGAALVMAINGRASAASAPTIPPLSFGTFDGTVKEMKALRAAYSRIAAHWATLEPTEGTFNWSTLDAVVVPRSKAGIRVVIAIHSNSPWGSVCGGFAFSTPSDRPAFKHFVQTMAERYDGDGFEDVAGLGVPVRYYQVENQWMTAVFYRDRTNCPASGSPPPPEAGEEPSPAAGDLEANGDPLVAASDFVDEFTDAHDALAAAGTGFQLGPGNIPSGATDAALFCLGRLGKKLTQNILKPDGTVKETLLWTKAQVCKKAGPNERGIKSFIRYNNVVLEAVMPAIQPLTDYIDIAQYGLYQNVPLRNQWLKERSIAWGFGSPPALVSWELAGPDRRALAPGPNPIKDVAFDLVKRLSLAFASGSASATWFHNHLNPAAAVGVRFTSLRDAANKKLPAYWNYKLLVDSLVGARRATVQLLPGGGYVVRFKISVSSQVIVAWSDTPRDASLRVKHTDVSVVKASGVRNPAVNATLTPGKMLATRLSNVPILVLD